MEFLVNPHEIDLTHRSKEWGNTEVVPTQQRSRLRKAGLLDDHTLVPSPKSENGLGLELSLNFKNSLLN